MARPFEYHKPDDWKSWVGAAQRFGPWDRAMRMVSLSGGAAITGKLIRARRLRTQTALQLLVFSGVIRRANVEPPYHLRAEEAGILQPSETAGNVNSASLS